MFSEFDKVVSKLEKDFSDCLKFYQSKKLRKSNKQLSEDVSGLLETAIEELYDGAVAPKKDSEPDIYYNKIPVEIKTTNGEQWRGGAFSKRDGYYLLVSWELIDNKPKFFIAGLNMTKEDWSGGNIGNYYATGFDKKSLVKKHTLNECKLYKGSIKRYYRGKQPCIKLIKE